jgi:hypothetical protein
MVSVDTNERGAWLFPGQISRYMGIDANAQRQAIERQSWSQGWTCVTHVQLPGDAQVRSHFALHERRVPMWIATITASRIKSPDVRATVEAWQNEFADALYEYLKNGGVIRQDATYEQVEELYRKIKSIRASEKHAHRRLTDLIMRTANDYDSNTERVRNFFSTIQNFLLYAATGEIASELKKRPILCYEGKNGPTKADLNVAKNFMTADELHILESLVDVFFSLADIRVMFRDDVTLELWQQMLVNTLHVAGRPVLNEDRPWMTRSWKIA